MADQSVAFLNSLRKGGDPETDLLREAVRHCVHELMDEEAPALVGAERYERSAERARAASTNAGAKQPASEQQSGRLGAGEARVRRGRQLVITTGMQALPQRRATRQLQQGSRQPRLTLGA